MYFQEKDTESYAYSALQQKRMLGDRCMSESVSSIEKIQICTRPHQQVYSVVQQDCRRL